MLRALLFFLVVFVMVSSHGQLRSEKDKKPLGIIIGNILESKSGKPVPFASIRLLKQGDTITVSATLSDKNGAFAFQNLPFGYYLLSVKNEGYAQSDLDSIFLRTERYDFNLGDIKLKESSNNLNDVVVYAEKPLIQNVDGKMIYNVGESASSNGASTAELLKNMPLINNDPNGKILLKGKEPKILIDDKPTDLTAQQLQDLLESLPGSSIEKIEVMTNPPPQYATETGGVINIITKKGKIGWVGKASISAGTKGEGNFYANISYRSKKISFATNVGVGASNLTGDSYSKRQNIYPDSSNRFNSESNYRNKNLRPSLRLQTDYTFNPRSILNLTYQGNINYFNNISNTEYTNINQFDSIYKISTRSNASKGVGFSHAISGSYTFKAKDLVEYIRLIASYNWGKNDNDRDFYQQFLDPAYMPTGIDSTQTQYFNTYNKSFTVRIDYNKPLPIFMGNFSAGTTYSKYDYHNTLNTSFLSKSDSLFVPNNLLSNDFFFDQGIHTARAGFTFIFNEQWHLNFGAQAEHTTMSFDFIKGNSNNVSNSYWNVLPNITLRREFDKSLNTALVYRASIRRPGLGELNPNIDYSDPYNLRFGNPFLQPSLSDNFDWNISWIKGKFYINTSLGYNKVKQVINSYRTLVGSGKTLITYINIADRKEYESSAWGGYTFNRWFRMNASMGYTFNEYAEAEKILYKYQNGGSFYTTIQYNFTANNLFMMDGSARFSSYADPQGKSRSNLTMNLGFQYKFFDRRLIVGLNIADPIRSQAYYSNTYGTNFNIESYSSSNTRNFRITVAYQLNKLVQKNLLTDKQKQAVLDKLKKR
jgi:outer membrane receptor protein involved in Fe transport